LVEKFLNKEIFFFEIVDNLIKLFSQKNIVLFCKKTKIKTIADINKVIGYGDFTVNKL
jgi:hypothetical protein